MNIKQEEHLSRLVNLTTLNMMKKYRAGAEEHGGVLTEMPLKEILENALEEAIDQVVYIQTALDKVNSDKLND